MVRKTVLITLKKKNNSSRINTSILDSIIKNKDGSIVEIDSKTAAAWNLLYKSKESSKDACQLCVFYSLFASPDHILY